MRISPEVEIALALAQREASRRRHEYVTVDHLLFALLFDEDIVGMLRHAGGNPATLKKRLEKFLDLEVSPLPDVANVAFPTFSLGLNRVLKRSTRDIQASREDELTGVDILISLFDESDCPAVIMLGEQITRLDVVAFISNGISKANQDEDAVKRESVSDAYQCLPTAPNRATVAPQRRSCDTSNDRQCHISEANPVDVFISYAAADDALREELEQHLAGLRRTGVLRTWSVHRIAAGDDWKRAIETHISQAQIVLLLVSANYLASDYLYEVQAMTALARAKTGDARVILILIHACDLDIQAFKGLVLLPSNRVPVSSWQNQHEAWRAVAHGIREAITGPNNHIVPPEPAYDSAESRALAEQIEVAQLRRTALAAAGTSTEAADQAILDLRRRLRQGGQLHPGDSLGDGRYLLLRQLGRGGFAAVWAALDRTQNVQVAIKVLHVLDAAEASRRERFFRGARVMNSLRHEGIVRVLEQRGEDSGYLYFVMELMAGGDLHRAVINGRIRPKDVVPLIMRVGQALGAAHAEGLVHRDVKPANILLDALGMPKLTDFDLVAARDTTGGTRTGALGTFPFTAPEQLHNAQDVDARADVYGLGMTLLFCLRGTILPAIVTRKPEEVIDALPCSHLVKEVITKTLELEPERRYPDARTFCTALRSAAIGQALSDIGHPLRRARSRPDSSRPPPRPRQDTATRHDAPPRQDALARERAFLYVRFVLLSMMVVGISMSAGMYCAPPSMPKKDGYMLSVPEVLVACSLLCVAVVILLTFMRSKKRDDGQ